MIGLHIFPDVLLSGDFSRKDLGVEKSRSTLERACMCAKIAVLHQRGSRC